MYQRKTKFMINPIAIYRRKKFNWRCKFYNILRNNFITSRNKVSKLLIKYESQKG